MKDEIFTNFFVKGVFFGGAQVQKTWIVSEKTTKKKSKKKLKKKKLKKK